MSSRRSEDEQARREQARGGASQAPEPTAPAGEDETLTGELGSEGGSQGELAQASRAGEEARALLLPRFIAIALLLLLGAVLLWLVVTMR